MSTTRLTKREKFAMASMQGLSANHLFFERGSLESTLKALGIQHSTPSQIMAMVAVQNADALLAELEKAKLP